ncbi:MAG: peptidase S10 [Candidatus Sphingomonas colombiensis]|nr:peptidase S10 [Sphingomonas sp.]WEK42095.1 MAG: peptidase S10 [Sphingomonas sp.]
MKSALLTILTAFAAATSAHGAETPAKADAATPASAIFQPSEIATTGSVTIAGARIPYRAVAGTMVVHPKGWSDTNAIDGGDEKDAKKPKAEASMFYTAYFRNGVPAASRPITFLFNGGPGSSSIWLHMGAFGPIRVQTPDRGHAPGAPYAMVNNDESLLDVSDLVFIDAPGTGFSRIAGHEKEAAFYGVDQDIHAFSKFIVQFLSRYQRWNSPKYLFGESYGTMRAAGMTLALQKESVDLNGVILLSDILNWDLIPDDPQANPGIDQPYIVSLPTYAATAWYHQKLANRPADLPAFLAEVEQFATGNYALALMQGNTLPAEKRQAIAARLSGYTGLPVAYLLKSNLRIEYGAFQKELLAADALTTGTLDTRFTGATLDPLSKVSSYDPQSTAIEAAYVAAFNSYARGTLRYGDGIEFKPGVSIYESWDYKHQPPGAARPLIALPNVLPDLAIAMKQNPQMKLLVTGGYFDVSTPYFAGVYELRHLPVPANIQANIDYRHYESGHMVYVNPTVLKAFHTDVADFIRRTDNIK